MEVYIDYEGITELLAHAHNAGRPFLFEYEVYSMLKSVGAETPPKTRFIPRGIKPDDEDILRFIGEKIVLKVVSPTIIHKTEVGGVRIVAKTPDAVRSGIRRMMCEIPEKYAALIQQDRTTAPDEYKHLEGTELLTAITADIEGIMLAQFMPPDSEAFGNELIVGLRKTREFGMVFSAGLGGTDTELYAERFRKGQAIVVASTAMTTGEEFFELFKHTISYCKLAGLTRGQRRIVTDDQLIECFEAFIRLGNYYSEENPDAPFYLDEVEINPFAFTDFLMVPLDGICKFSLPTSPKPARPIERIHNLLHPRRIGLIGVSATRKNFGRIILDNILEGGVPPKDVVIIREGSDQIDGVTCVPNLEALTEPVDLFVVCIGAEQVPALVDDLLHLKVAKSVMLIPGGIGETEGSQELAKKMISGIEEAHLQGSGGPVFLGANCMGVISRPGNYDTWFIPKDRCPRDAHAPYLRTALVSQSGGFMVGRTSQVPELAPAYMISMGNQTDLTLGDMMQYFCASEEVDVIAVYAEGFQDGDGLSFANAVRTAVLAGKSVVFYKAGRTPEGKNATSGHTASLAGDYMVCENCVKQAGAIVARSFNEFQDLVYMASAFATVPVHGKRIAGISGAGFETVGMADSLHSDDYNASLSVFSAETKSALAKLLARKKLSKLVSIQNPLDINPSADDETYAEAGKILLQDNATDALIISFTPYSPNVRSLSKPNAPAEDVASPEGIVHRFLTLPERKQKPVVGVVDGGHLFEAMREEIKKGHVPVFSSCDTAVAVLSVYLEARLHADMIREQAKKQTTPPRRY